ncbi:unnamed protein product [Trifolium pratense]|uniref:Uncharacterized protein n=1 Tax=Trifolium pratense TaxID=57577 RepID=A0ACB0K4B8_TRIPR|nr:unnamed protein product [Trifolium pratense]
MGEDFEIPGFTNASHDPVAWNQGGENPFVSGGINIQGGGNTFINQRGGGGTPFNLGNIQGGINEFNVGGGRRTSSGINIQGGGNAFINQSGEINIQGGGNTFINQSGGGGTPFNLGNIQGGRNKFNVSGGGRASGGNASGKRTSGGINIQGRGNAFINQSGCGINEFNVGGGGRASAARASAEVQVAEGLAAEEQQKEVEMHKYLCMLSFYFVRFVELS